MTVEQFNFKPSLEFGIKEVAVLPTGKDSKVVIRKNDITINLLKYLNNRVVYNVCFMNNEFGETGLKKALKTISKRK